MTLSVLMLAMGLMATLLFSAVKITAERRLPISSIAILSFGVSMFVSGIVHLSRPTSVHDAYVVTDALQAIFISGVLLAALVCMLAGMGLASRSPLKPAFVANQELMVDIHRNRALLVASGVVLAAVSVMSYLQLSSVVEFEQGKRIISLEGGYARFFFATMWAPIAFLLLLLGILGYFPSGRRRYFVLVMAMCLAAYLMLNSFGGRSIIFVMIFPLCFLFVGLIRLGSASVAGVFTILIVGMLYLMTTARFDYYAIEYSGAFDLLLDSLEWGFGRFSMIGFSDWYLKHYDATIGGFIWNDILSFFGALLLDINDVRVFGLEYQLAQILTGQVDHLYLAPGVWAQVYIDFSPIGMVMLCGVYGYAIARMERQALTHSNLYVRILCLYLSIFFVIVWPQTKFGGVFNILIILSPLVGLYLLERLMSRIKTHVLLPLFKSAGLTISNPSTGYIPTP